MKLEFHHINYVSEDVDRLHKFYTEVLGMADIPAEHFPRPDATSAGGYSGKIKFATDGGMQMHLAEKESVQSTKSPKLPSHRIEMVDAYFALGSQIVTSQ